MAKEPGKNGAKKKARKPRTLKQNLATALKQVGQAHNPRRVENLITRALKNC